jgi:D-xylose transport system substrate-binding protein
LVQARAKEIGAKITVRDAEGNDELQLQQANQLLDAGVDVLIVVPHDANKAAAICRRLRESECLLSVTTA